VTAEPATEARAARVQAALQGQPALVVLDDAWTWEHVAPFRCFAAPGCACLLTTRDERIAQRFAPQQNERVQELPLDQAVELLATLRRPGCQPAPRWAGEASPRRRWAAARAHARGGYLVDHVTFEPEARLALDRPYKRRNLAGPL